MSIENLNISEAIWIVISGVGLFFAYREYQKSKQGHDEALQQINGVREARLVVTSGYLFRARVQTLVFGLWLALGVLFGFFDTERLLGGIPRVAGLGALFVGAAGFALIGVQQARERNAVDQELLEADNEHSERTVVAIERQADAAERIANNTDPEHLERP